MRNLTIKRIKTGVGCLARLKVYIEDPTTNEIAINNIPCRKIGDIKNGESKTFPIEENAAKIFVIADKLSKEYCNEYYQLPEGNEDILLSGKCRFNPAVGNAFRFDNNESEEVIRNRRRGNKKGLIIFIISIVIGAVGGYLLASGTLYNKAPEEKTFSSDGLVITLTDEFTKVDVDNFTVAYDSKNIAVLALKEDFSLAEGFGDNTLEQYADLVIQSSQLNDCEIETEDGLTKFNYNFTNPETKDTYRYFTYVYKEDDAFWTIQFATLEQNAEKYESEIEKWAQLVEFTE